MKVASRRRGRRAALLAAAAALSGITATAETDSWARDVSPSPLHHQLRGLRDDGDDPNLHRASPHVNTIASSLVGSFSGLSNGHTDISGLHTLAAREPSRDDYADGAEASTRHEKSSLFREALPVACRVTSTSGREAFQKVALSVRNNIAGLGSMAVPQSARDGTPVGGGTGSGMGSLISGRISRQSLKELESAEGVEMCGPDGEVRAVDDVREGVAPFSREDGIGAGRGGIRRGLRATASGSRPEQRRRRLLEQVGAGNALIQADLLEVGPHPKTVCVADSGYMLGHADLPSDPSYVGGANVTHYDGQFLPWNKDLYGHGTHVAGIVAALENNYGIRGVGNLKLYITRALDNGGRGHESDVVAAINQCLAAKAEVIVLALGTFLISWFDSEYFDKIYQQNNVLVFAAAGNVLTSQHGEKFYPASYRGVISIAATKANGERWAPDTPTYGKKESMMNDQVELATMGYYVNSTYPDDDGYAIISGTSMAAGFGGAAAALLWSHFPGCSAYQVRNALAASARNYYSGPNQDGCDDKQGHGIIKVKDAYNLIKSLGCDLGGVNFISNTDDACAARPAGGRLIAPPTAMTTSVPSSGPSASPSSSPSAGPTSSPSALPSESFTTMPSLIPSEGPSGGPSAPPSLVLSSVPTISTEPSAFPTTSSEPSSSPSLDPTSGPTVSTSPSPPPKPSSDPSASPTLSSVPSTDPTRLPATSPSHSPSTPPSLSSTDLPSTSPSVPPSTSSSPTEYPEASIGATRDKFDADEDSVVEFVDPKPRGDDWVVLYEHRDIPETATSVDRSVQKVTWKNACGDRTCSAPTSSGTVSFSLSLPGEYRAYLLRGTVDDELGGYEILARSDTFEVEEENGDLLGRNGESGDG